VISYSVQADVGLAVLVGVFPRLHFANLRDQDALAQPPVRRIRINRSGVDRVQAHVEDVAAGKPMGIYCNLAQVGGHPVDTRQVGVEDRLTHRGCGQGEFHMSGNPTQERLVVISEQVGCHHNHAAEPVEFLHERVAVLVDRSRAALAHRHPAGEQTVGFVEEQHRLGLGGFLERLCDVLCRVAEILADDLAVIDLVERLAEPPRDAQGGAGLPSSRRAVEVEDAAAGLRLDLAQLPHRFQLLAHLNGAEGGGNVVAHRAVEHEAGEVVAGFRVNEDADRRGLLLPSARARRAVVLTILNYFCVIVIWHFLVFLVSALVRLCAASYATRVAFGAKCYSYRLCGNTVFIICMKCLVP